ncbi:Hypothetical predicted protein [Cloeon dipterum]|uniref:Uncharacterized protein n=1 Tax=Cloeon dipterum TaxID=197152 RepID=A0A8S1CUW2_9INSE|nr:Hypothetical predicted protein [Cloeon dipterum]
MRLNLVLLALLVAEAAARPTFGALHQWFFGPARPSRNALHAPHMRRQAFPSRGYLQPQQQQLQRQVWHVDTVPAMLVFEEHIPPLGYGLPPMNFAPEPPSVPVLPAPVEPAPVPPVPAEPAPVEPAPVQPNPEETTPIASSPEGSLPPENIAQTEPPSVPVDPEPVAPSSEQPVEPALSNLNQWNLFPEQPSRNLEPSPEQPVEPAPEQPVEPVPEQPTSEETVPEQPAPVPDSSLSPSEIGESTAIYSVSTVAPTEPTPSAEVSPSASPDPSPPTTDPPVEPEESATQQLGANGVEVITEIDDYTTLSNKYLPPQIQKRDVSELVQASTESPQAPEDNSISGSPSEGRTLAKFVEELLELRAKLKGTAW